MLFRQRFRGAISFVGIGIKQAARTPDTQTPTITSGIGAPTASAFPGSIYMRQDGANADQMIYCRIGGAWVALSGT